MTARSTKTVFETVKTLGSISVFAFLVAFSSAANAETLKSARVTQIIKDVKLLGDQGARTAAVSDEVREGAAVRTGVESRAELTFADLTITRLGANTVFSFNEGARQVNLDSGALLLQVPKGGAAVRINTAAATAAITGGTCLCESNKGFPLKVLVMEGAGQVCSKEHPEQCETAHGGEMVTMTVDGQITKPVKFKADLVYKTSKLINGFPPLPNADLIFQVIETQQAQLLAGPLDSGNPIDTQDQRSAASPTPSPPPQSTPGPTPPPSKFGPPTTITSPNPYVINSGTQIQTDPTIVTNGVTSFGKIYRDESQDGTVPQFLYGSTRPFDAQVFEVGGGNQDGPYAVFKFSSLELTGNPTISTVNGGATNLALVSVGNITSGAPGGTLTFAGLQNVFIGTQDGSINLGPELAFNGLSKLEFYARGNGSSLTLASPISAVNKVKLYAEGAIQVNANENVTSFKAISGGDFLVGSGVVTATDIDIHSLSNINIDGSKFPDLPDGGGSITLNAANTLNIAVTGGTNTRNDFSAQGTTINLTSATPVVLTFSSASAIFTGGSGGIVGPNVGLVGADMEISTTSGGNIHLYSVGVLNSTLTGFVHAAGSFTSEADVTTHELTAGTSIAIGGNIIANDITAGSTASGTIHVTGRLAAFGTVTAGGNITADTVAVPTINAPNGILTAGSGGIHPFIENSSGPNDGAMIQHTHNVASVVSPNGIDFSGNQFNGIDGFSSGGLLTINATTLSFDPATGIGIVNFNGADAGAFSGGQTPTTGGDGGTFIANATGDITTTSNSPITATTGLTDAFGFSGKGGTVTLASTTGTVTVDSTIQVSSDDPIPNQTPPPPIRRSAQGGNINLTSGKATGLAINIGKSAQLLSLLNAAAPGPGGVITISATGQGGSSIDIDNSNGNIEADRGTVDINHQGDGGIINITNANMRADIIKIGILGANGSLNIGGGTITADTLLRLYASSSDGSINFTANVTLTSQSMATVIAAHRVTIFDGVIVTIGGPDPAQVTTDFANYTGSGGNGSTTGMFAGAGAVTNGSGGGMTTTVTYLGAPAGNWSSPASWNPAVVPNNSGGTTYNAAQSSGMLIQDIAAGVTIEQFQMSGGTLRLDNPLHLNAGLQFSGGTINGGNLFTAGSSTQSALMTVNGLTITNSGNYSIAFDSSDVFSGSATFNNSGTLSKTTGTGSDNFNIALNNSGTVSAQLGMLRFVVGGTSAGTFSASTGATVEFASNWTFTNGTHFSGAGTIQLDNNTTTNLSGTITNSGTILLNSGANFTDLRIADGTTLSGSGSLILSDSPYNRIYGTANSGTETLTNVNNTISGAGQIGVSNSIEFINQSAGVIDATSATNALIITPTTNSTLVSANGGGFVNQGLLEATAAGGLVLSGGQFNNKGGMINAVGSGNNVFLQSNVIISGGTLSDSGGGLIQTAAGYAATLDGTSQGALTIAGTYQGSNSSATFLNGTITNTGTILLNSTGNFTDLLVADGTTLTGGGSLILSDSPNNRIWGTTNSGAETLTNVNNTISGAGQIGVSNSIEFINQSAGVINATSATNALIISPTTNGTLVSANGGGFVNQGLLEATAAGGLVLNGGQFNNTGGVILADGVTSQVLINNSTSVTGGTLRTTNGGFFSISGNAAVDQLTGTSGTVTVTTAGSLSAVNGINFNGVNGGPGGTLSLSAPSVTFGTGVGQINGALFNGGDATSPSSPGGDGGNFTVTATSGDITVGSDIEASTGANGSSVSTGGTGGTVNLTANNGQVTVNNRIQVSHKSGTRKSAAGGNINITSGKTSGVAINVTNSGQLLALLDAAAPGPGGKITILASGGNSQINVAGTVAADRGTVDVRNTGADGSVNIAAGVSDSIAMRGDIVKIGALGTNGALTIGAGTISADTILKLYAGGSNGTIDFVANVTLSSGSAMYLAANTISIEPTFTVTITGNGGPANIYTNNPNYSGFGGTNPSNGTFGGNGANAPQPLPSAPPFGPPPQHPQHLPVGH